MTYHDELRKLFFENAWRWAAGMTEREMHFDRPSYETLKVTEWDAEFIGRVHKYWRSPKGERLMRNRLIMGAFRYDLFEVPDTGNYDAIGSCLRRLDKYIETGNTELLIDIANLCMKENIVGQTPGKYYRPVYTIGKCMGVNGIRIALRQYKHKPNTHFLVIAAASALHEFDIGYHETKHFASSDDGEHVEKKR